MQKITILALLCVTHAAFAMDEPNHEASSRAPIPIPFKKNESFFSKVLKSNPLQQIDMETVKNIGKKVGKAAVCVSAIFLPSMYSDVTIDYVSNHLVELGMTSVQSMIPVIIHSADTLIASVAAFKCAELFSSHAAARFSASLIGGVSALCTSGQLGQVTELLPALSRQVTDHEVEEILSSL